MADDNSGQTFGVELEFLLIYDRKPFIEHFDLFEEDEDEDEEDDARLAIVSVLEEDGTIPVFDYYGKVTHNLEEKYRKWRVDEDGSVDVGMERTLLNRDDQAWQVADIEVKSRIFNLHDDDWKSEINHFMQLLLSKFNGPDTQHFCRLIINNSCGLHVHVGKAPAATKQFELQTLKNLHVLSVGLERVIDEAHTVDRVAGNDRYGGYYCIPPSGLWRSSENLHPLQYISKFDAATKTHGDMSKITEPHNHHSSAYNFQHTFRLGAFMGLADGCDGRPLPGTDLGTVEFRQHRATLESQEIIAWVEFVTGMMTFCETTSREGVLAFVTSKVEDADYHFPELVQDLRIHQDVGLYYRGVLAPGYEEGRRDRSLLEIPEASWLRPIVEYYEDQRYYQKDYYSVRGAIGNKLKKNKLGFFPEKFLAALDRHYFSRPDDQPLELVSKYKAAILDEFAVRFVFASGA